VPLTQKKIGQAVPVFGTFIGAGVNAATLNRLSEVAEMLYRERFLYGRSTGCRSLTTNRFQSTKTLWMLPGSLRQRSLRTQNWRPPRGARAAGQV